MTLEKKRKILERIVESAVWTITKYKNDKDYKAGKFYEKVRFKGNALVDEGINALWTIIAGSGETLYNNTSANLIVGTGSGGEDPSDDRATFTAGAVKGMEGGFPTYGTSEKAIWKASYGSGDANQVWAEFGVLNDPTGGKLMNRKVSAQGTKTAGQTWELTLEITLS